MIYNIFINLVKNLQEGDKDVNSLCRHINTSIIVDEIKTDNELFEKFDSICANYKSKGNEIDELVNMYKVILLNLELNR